MVDWFSLRFLLLPGVKWDILAANAHVRLWAKRTVKHRLFWLAAIRSFPAIQIFPCPSNCSLEKWFLWFPFMIFCHGAGSMKALVMLDLIHCQTSRCHAWHRRLVMNFSYPPLYVSFASAPSLRSLPPILILPCCLGLLSLAMISLSLSPSALNIYV